MMLEGGGVRRKCEAVSEEEEEEGGKVRCLRGGFAGSTTTVPQ